MLENIKVSFDVIEMMAFFWESVRAKEKVADAYMVEVANKEDMKPFYNEDFSPESVRKALSALVNRELLNGSTKAESRFWSENMRMTEDLGLMRETLQPVKQLNLDNLKTEFQGQSKYNEVVVAFGLGHFDTYYVDENKITINFFKIIPDFITGEMKIEGQDFKEYIENRVREIL
ncbi:MAG: hypothetical protein Q4E36_04970 [Bacillota bacterium]|nr:hypothetical protein [Bacillota bacterium]